MEQELDMVSSGQSDDDYCKRMNMDNKFAIRSDPHDHSDRCMRLMCHCYLKTPGNDS